MAISEWGPADSGVPPDPSAGVDNVAEPLVSWPVTVNAELLSVSVTVPVGVPVPLVGATVTLKTTAWPKVEGLGDVKLRLVEVGRLLGEFTATDKRDEVLGLKFPSPE